METHQLDHFLKDHPFFDGLQPEDLAFIASCGKNVVFHPNDVVCQTGKPADQFYILRDGHVAIEMVLPGQGPLTLQTLGEGDVFGWSWLIPPHIWKFDAHAILQTRAVALDGRCLREKCEEEPRLGFELMKRFSQVMTQRLAAARLQLLDLYGNEPREKPDE